MKKFSIYMLAALGILAASCEDDLVPPTPQQNPQEPVITTGNIQSEKTGVLVAGQEGQVPSVDLKDFTDEGAAIPVIKCTQAENLNEGATLVYHLELSDTPDFTKKEVLNLKAGDAEDTSSIYYADPMEWNTAHINLFGQSPKPQTAYYRVPVYINLASTDFRYDSNDYYAADGSLIVSRMTPDFSVESAYYVFGPYIGGNSPATGVQMQHSDLDEYDDPSFTYFFEVTEAQIADFSILVAPKSVKEASGNASACYGAGQEEGSLVLAGAPIKVTEAGPYKLEVNMKELTYTLAVAPKMLYAPSKGAMFSKKCLTIPTEDYINYQGITYLEESFAITGQKGWNPVAYAKGDAAGMIKFYGPGIDKDKDAWIPVEKKGSHWLKINLAKLTYEATHIATLGLVGNFNNWGETPDPEMSHDANYIVWKGEFTVAEASADKPCEWKVRANSDWAVSFGEPKWDHNGTLVPDQTDFDGGNYKITEPGTYEVVLNVGSFPYTMTCTKK